MNQTLKYLLLAIFTMFAIHICLAAEPDDFPKTYKASRDANGNAVIRYGLIDKYGNRISNAIYEKISPFASNRIALVKKDGLYGYLYASGEYFIEPYLKDAQSFNEFGLAAIKIESKWGIINNKREWVLKDIFDKIEPFQDNGLTIVKYESKYGLVDTLGNVVLSVIYDKVENFDNTGYAYIKIGKHFGVVDKQGRPIVPTEYKDKKSAMAAVSNIKPKFENLKEAALAMTATEGQTSPTATDSENKRQEEEQRLLAEKSRQEEEQRYAEARKRLKETSTLKNYIAANLGDWNDYLASKSLGLPSEEEIRNFIEKEIRIWQVKGEFEPTAKWKERVNDSTRTAKITTMADSIFSENSKKVDAVRAEYKKAYEALADKFCYSIAEQFASQNLEIRPYDADNETFLICTSDFGNFLLPVPLEDAPDFKKDWDRWKKTAIATFVPNGEDVVLKSVKIGEYSYDSDMNATYAQVDVEYNFKPIDVAQLYRNPDADENFAMSSTISGPSNRNAGIQTETVKISAGSTPDIDINIPEGTPTAIPTFAVVIANGDYAHASKVSHAENDGRIMTQYLTRTLGIPENNVATFINATYGQMASAISMLQDVGDAYKGSDFNIIFYYVGHGLPDDEGKKSYILPVDIDPRQVSICMPLDKIYANLGNIGAKNVTVMVDACFSGTNHGDGMLIP
ncbi:MAG: WG repeat-containing protein, partial [Muribaculaceae bacterium]|nr:WG repeat-containing protein [Muribaculaceae bacterium]